MHWTRYTILLFSRKKGGVRRVVLEYRCKLVGGNGQQKSMPEPSVVSSKPKLRLALGVSEFRQIRRKSFKLLGIAVLAVVSYFGYHAWKHLVYGQLSVSLRVGFGMLPLLPIPVTFFGLIIGTVLLIS